MEARSLAELLNLNNLQSEGMIPFFIDVILVTCITITLSLFLRSLFHKNNIIIARHKEDQAKSKTHTLLCLEFFSALQNSLYICLWLYGSTIVVELICLKIEFSKVIIVEKVRYILIAIILSSATFKAISLIEKKYYTAEDEERVVNQYHKMLFDLIIRGVKLLIIVITALVIMHQFGISIATLLSLGGFSGLILGFASKDLLSNFFGTLMIYLDTPFIIGDEIKVESDSGIVEKIDLRMTTLRQKDKSLLYIPNSIFSTASIINISRISHKPISEEITILYTKKESIDLLISSLYKFLKEYKSIDQKQLLTVELYKVFDDSVVLKINCFCSIKKTKAFLDFKNILLIDIAKIIEQNNLRIENKPRVEV